MNTIKFQVAALAAAVSTMAAVSAQANDVATDSANQPINLETVTVTALPGDGTATQAQQPVTLLSGEDLERERRASLGDTLSQQPGIQNSGFGAAVGRPVIRGMGGARIKVLQDGLEAADASSVSPDHAVAVESDTAQQIEVLRGPATLLYGSGALGGVVNVVSAPLEQNSDETHVGLSYSTADTGRQVTAGHQARGDRWAWHINGSERRTEEYRIPSAVHDAEHDEEETEEEHHEAERDFLTNSDIEFQRQASAGVTYFGDSSETSVNVGYLASKFGLPGHDHEDEHEEEADPLVDPLAEEEHEEEAARVDLERTRIALRHTAYDPFSGAESWQTDIAYTDYQHEEGHGDGEHGLTRFSREALDLRSELVLSTGAFIGGGTTQVAGIDAGTETFSALGGEALMPTTDTTKAGIFWLGENRFDDLTVNIGARYDYLQHDPETPDEIAAECGLAADDYKARSSADASLSAGIAYALTDSWKVTTSLTSAARAPSAQELFSCGPHESTFSYETGNADLNSERALNAELGAQFVSGSWRLNLSVFRNQISDYIYSSAVVSGGVVTEVDGLPLYAYQQADATIQGAELEAGVDLSSRWSLNLLADTVRGELDEGGYLPRMPADRSGIEFAYSDYAWNGGVRLMHYFEQDRLATYSDATSTEDLNETATPGFNLLSVNAGYTWIATSAEYRLSVEGTNLLDEVVRYHTSYVKDSVPAEGRGAAISFAARF